MRHPPRRPVFTHPNGFSMVEILLAIFILSIGLMMVATIFPVGATWTKDTVESSVGQNVSLNAMACIKLHYGPGGNLHDMLRPENFTGSMFLHHENPTGPEILRHVSTGYPPEAMPFLLQGLPGLLNIPLAERAYQLGSSNPYPARNPAACTYFWTAVGRVDTQHRGSNGVLVPSLSYVYDIYIIVFHKGEASQMYPTPAGHDAAREVPSTRGPSELLIPFLWYTVLNNGVKDPTPETELRPALGQIGIGIQSGTVFRQFTEVEFHPEPRPPLAKVTGWLPPDPQDPIGILPQWTEQVIAPYNYRDVPTRTSPQILYVYQTSVTF